MQLKQEIDTCEKLGIIERDNKNPKVIKNKLLDNVVLNKFKEIYLAHPNNNVSNQAERYAILTMIGMQFAALLGGAVIVETVFAWPGVGRLIVQSITNNDFMVVEATVVLLAMTFVFINFVVDILYGVINPRVRMR